MQLSKRLEALAKMVTPANSLADVGCDHGYIPIYLVEKQKISHGIAMDIGEGPLMRAQENIRKHGLEKYIETRLSDGLAALEPGECGSILISGMGGLLMEKILTEGRSVADEARELICQPQSDIGCFRRFLAESEYEIVEENMIYEDGKYYPMMKAVRGRAVYRPEELEYGPALLKMRHPVLREFLEKEANTLQDLDRKLEKQQSKSAQDRRKQLSQKHMLTREALRYYER